MRHLRADELEIHRRIDLAQQVVLRHEFLERHHLEFVLRGHGRLQHHAIKNKNPPLGEGLSAIWTRLRGGFFFARLARPRRGPASCAARERTEDAPTMHRRCADRLPGESCGRPPGGPRAITLRAIGSIETIMR
ncbi:putative transposase [Burkholderia mallei]|nr:putative transposase [Burkholderia mallei]